jgi:hypothetical protein
MMDALKFAFEILIVGALALPWLAILIRIFDHSAVSEKPKEHVPFHLSVVPESVRPAVAAVFVIAVGYLLGSAVSRISRNFFDDELWGRVPTEGQIRNEVYRDVYCKTRVVGDESLPMLASQLARTEPRNGEWMCAATHNGTDPSFKILAREMFRLQESQLLFAGQDKVDRLKQYNDQINILRGAAFNGLILSVVCLFGWCGNVRQRISNPILKVLLFLPAGLVAFWGALSLWDHWHEKVSLYNDPPLAELVLLLLGVGGLFVVAKAREKETFYVPTCVVAVILTFISFGGWWWTEVMYDLQVIHSLPELQLRDSTVRSVGRD